MTLAFTVLKPEDSGYYECIGENRVARDAKGIDVNVSGKKFTLASTRNCQMKLI